MRKRFGARTVLVVLACGLAAASLGLGLASCSLGLDESLIGQTPETGVADIVAPDTLVPEGGDGALPPIMPEGGVCAKDQDCKGTTGCLTAKCDIPRKACVFNVCRTPACNSASCDQAAQKCTAAKPYKFRATQFPVSQPVGCGGALSRCFAAVYPFVFVGGTNGVLAYAANDPQNAAPASVPVVGLGFVPNQIIASGSRVFFLGTPQGSGTSSRIPIGYADVPPNPFATKIVVTTILATVNRAPGDGFLLYPRGNDTALLVDQAVAAAFAAVPVEPPIAEPAVLNTTGVGFTAGAVPLAVSGARLVTGQTSGVTGATTFSFVNAAGSMAPMTITDVAIPTATPGAGPEYFAQSADGAIFWAYVALTQAPPPPVAPAPYVRAAKGYFLVADSTANFDPAAGINLEVYNAPNGTPSVGPVAMLDAKTVMVTTAVPANPTLATNVGFVTRLPTPALVKNADMMPRRSQILLGIGQLAAAGSNGLGYILAVDPAAPLVPTVYVFDPGCAP